MNVFHVRSTCAEQALLQWRLFSLASAGLALGVLVASAAQAQSLPLTLPDAGRLLNDLNVLPAPPQQGNEVLPQPVPVESVPSLPANVRFRIVRFEIDDSSAFDALRLQHLLDDLRGDERSLDTLEQAVARITRFYRQHGYLLARAYLPEQNIAGGTVEIHVLEGRLGKISVHNTSSLSSTAVQRHLEQIGINQALQGAVLERNLLLLSDLPGIVVRSALAPGTTVGATDLEVAVTAGRRADADVSLDNYGNRYTGQYHAGANLALNNPSGIGDQFSANLISAGDQFNYGRFTYQLPLTDAGTRLGFSYATMIYRLGQDFSDLEAYGTARIAGVTLTQPLLRSRSVNLNAQARFEHKLLIDRIGLTDEGSEKILNNLTLGLFGDLSGITGNPFNPQGIGQNQHSLSLTWGHLSMDQASAVQDAEGHRTQGDFVKGNAQWLHLQRLNEHNSALVQLSAQLSGSNLDSAEKMSMGGPYAVRAYPAGEAPADDVLMLNTELRREFTPQWQGILFADIARGRLNHSPIAADGSNLRILSGPGLGARWAGAAGFRLQATLAWRTGNAPQSDHDKLPRLWLQMGKVF